MKIGLVTNWSERCGVSEYARNLVEHCMLYSDIQFKLVSYPLTYEHIAEETKDVDLIHFNYASGIFRYVGTNDWHKFRESGKKTLMTFHDSSPDMALAASKLFDGVVIHGGESCAPNVVVIPQGVRLVDVSDIPLQGRVGTAGFPFPWKGFLRLAYAAKQLDLKCLMIMAESEQINAHQVKRDVLSICSSLEVIVGWFGYDEIVRHLASSIANVFPYDMGYRLGNQQYPMNGISAGVRFGLSARRPVIVSRCMMFNDLLPYEDEIYFAEDGLGLEHTIIQVYKDVADGCAKMPKRILEDMSWDRCARLYNGIYEELYDFEPNDERGRLPGADTGGTDSPVHLVCDRDVVAKARA